MGSSSTKESRSPSVNATRTSSSRQSHASAASSTTHANTLSVTDGLPIVYASRSSRSRQSDVPFLRFSEAPDRDGTPPEPRKETRQEREARKLEKERVARLKERERSVREEGVDGGYLVTLGTYTGPEDFNKSVVRQLMIERRLAPFWKGLNDHSDSWTEHQLVAAARGLPIPSADEIPQEDPLQFSTSPQVFAEPSDTKTALSGVKILSSSMSQPSGAASELSSPQTSHHQASSSVPTISQSTLSPLFRGRAKTFASLTSSSKPQAEFTLPEIQLPRDPHVNGQPVEAYLYKDAAECPICFLYYPPYLNKTRCCDQSICSECFVQIKRPDPHPEHAEPTSSAPGSDPESGARPLEPEGQLISEPAACPFCVQPEFGVTYESPPFRRGLAYPVQSNPLARTNSAMSSNSSLSSSNTGTVTPSAVQGRRRTHSISASAPTVITTDKVRPDWAKKLSDARSQAARRAAAATALHTAAYLMGPPGTQESTWLGRRRRGNTDVTSSRLPEAFGIGSMGYLLAALEGQGSSRAGGANPDLFPGRQSSRRTRVDDLEDMMMMEAIRLSLAAEDDRKKKEEKEAAKQAKKDEKRNIKESKRAEKNAKKSGLYRAESNESGSALGSSTHLSSMEESRAEEGKGKAKAVSQNAQSYLGFNPLSEPTSTLNSRPISKDENSKAPMPSQFQVPDSQANIFGTSPAQGSHLRHMSNASSLESLISESTPRTPPNETGAIPASFNQPPSTSASQQPSAASDSFVAPASADGNSGVENMLNFSSLAAIIDRGHPTAASKHIQQIEEGSPATVQEPESILGTGADSISPNYEEHSSGNSDGTADEDIIERTTRPANTDAGVDDKQDFSAADLSERPLDRRVIR